MKYSESFDEYSIVLSSMIFIDYKSLLELKELTEAIMYTFDLIPEKDEQFTMIKKQCRRNIELDLAIINNALKRKTQKNYEEAFYKAKKQLRIDLSGAQTSFSMVGL
ncbi:hypothetical protein BDD43_3305 [Mucilaginibacter gracilis]|uniref:Uncharacterized protein n=1 Tax=Mucilaginibacter gracilis TaxID=423350 RepID=A0A495J435_9SPHI|nr:hypothetical protein [Mucilaginibacter gracilis]RKR83104.1 hypothetical protein BDD43_3305 [Mucilaginibacter gracilis]